MFVHCYTVLTLQLIESKIYLPLKMWGFILSRRPMRCGHTHTCIHLLTEVIAYSILNTHKKYESCVNFKTSEHLSRFFFSRLDVCAPEPNLWCLVLLFIAYYPFSHRNVNEQRIVIFLCTRKWGNF